MSTLKLTQKLFITITIFCIATLTAWTNELAGEDVMQKVDKREKAKTSKQTTTMTLIDKRGNKRVRTVIGYKKDYGNVEKTVMLFEKPSDVKGVGYLSYSYDAEGKDNDTWLFLPALGKSRRISGSSKNDDFMGTDFTYDDMGGRNVNDDTHKLLKEESINGNKYWVIESTPKESGYMYSKTISWIRQDILIAVKVEFYDKQSKLMKILTNSEATKINNIWTIKKMEMENIQRKHKTVIKFENIELNIPVNNSYFTVASLERGRIR